MGAGTCFNLSAKTRGNSVGIQYHTFQWFFNTTMRNFEMRNLEILKRGKSWKLAVSLRVSTWQRPPPIDLGDLRAKSMVISVAPPKIQLNSWTFFPAPP